MADEKTENYLIQWKLENLVPHFKDQEITFERLQALRKDLIAELIPKVGPRNEFITNWEREFGLTAITDQKKKRNRSDGLSEEQADGPKGHSESDDSRPIEITADASSEDESHIDNVQQKNYERSAAQPAAEYQRPNLIERASKKPRDGSYVNDSEYHERTKGGQKNYLSTLLNNNNYGKALITEYKREAELSDKSSLLLCEIIASDLITSCHSTLSMTDYSNLADEILELFPNEKRETYFIPSTLKRNSLDGKAEKARGRLVDKFHNSLQLYRRMCGYGRSSSAGDLTNSTTPDINEDEEHSLRWLEHNRDLNEIEPHWRKTAKIRLQTLVKTQGTVSQYFKKYPVLTDAAKGAKLIDIDFSELYESDAAQLFVRWDVFFEKLYAVSKTTKVKGTIEKLLELLSNTEIDQHSKEFVQIMLLAHLVPPRSGTSVKGRKYWKPSAEESQQGIVVHVKVPGDIEEIHKEKVDRMFAYGLTVQPYIIGVGNKLKDVSQFYVIIDQVRYHFDSPVKALDICFKSFFTLNAEFPKESAQVWILLQHGLYRFKTENDKHKPHVTKILQKMGITDV